MFGAKRIQGQAVVAGIREVHRGNGDPDGNGEPWLVEEIAEAMWGRDEHHLVLDVHVPGYGPYRVEGEWRVPNRLGSLRKTITRNRRIRVGMTLPVLVNPAQFGEVEVDWKGFVASGQLEHYDEPGVIATIAGGIKDLVKDIRSVGDGGSGELLPPGSIRPGDRSHPPVAGVGFDQWITVNVAAMVEKVPRKRFQEYCIERGFPAHAVEEINTEWYRRAQSDEVVAAWYVYEIQKGRQG